MSTDRGGVPQSPRLPQYSMKTALNDKQRDFASEVAFLDLNKHEMVIGC